jgi:hypothetical protein
MHKALELLLAFYHPAACIHRITQRDESAIGYELRPVIQSLFLLYSSSSDHPRDYLPTNARLEGYRSIRSCRSDSFGSQISCKTYIVHLLSICFVFMSVIALTSCLFVQLFKHVSWYRIADGHRTEWMSRRGYQVDYVSIHFSIFANRLDSIRNISLASCSSAFGQYNDYFSVEILSTLRLVECSPHINTLSLFVGDQKYTLYKRIIVDYLSQHCQHVTKIVISIASAEAVRLLLASFPNLSKIDWYRMSDDHFVPIVTQRKIASYPNIKDFDCFDQSGLNSEEIISLMKACPNLIHLTCIGRWLCHAMREVMTLRGLKSIVLHHERCKNLPGEEVTPILFMIADHCLQLKELIIILGTDIDLRTLLIRNAMKCIIMRLSKLLIDITSLRTDHENPETSICSLFSSPGVDLRSLEFNTYDENADQIAAILKGCQNANKLKLEGQTSISEVMLKITDSCHQLVDLEIYYHGSVNGEAMLALLKSCHQIRSLMCRTPLEVKAYEALALHGGGLTSLKISSCRAPSDIYNVGGFPVDSHLYDSGFKQERTRCMACLFCHSMPLDVKSLTKFLSCFGVITHLNIDLPSFQQSANFLYSEVSVYHALNVNIRTPPGVTESLDSVFLAMMSGCRSLKTLSILSYFPKQCFVDPSTFTTFASMIKARENHLELLTYPKKLDLSQLKQLLPKLKLHPF